MNISDLWPESAVALGVLRTGVFFRLAVHLEEYLYRKSLFITGQTEGIVENIRHRLPGKSVVLLPNGISPERILCDGQRHETGRQVRQEFGLDGQFVVGYTGLHGLAQGLETMLEAAKLLKDSKTIIFAFFGDGPEKQKLVRLAKENRLESVRFFPPQRAARMPEIFAALDVVVVPLRRHALFRGARPSKLLEAMGAAVPVIASLEGESQVIIERAEAGICVEPENPHAMVEAILKLANSADLRHIFGENGRRFVTQNLNRVHITETLNRLLLMANDNGQKAVTLDTSAGVSSFVPDRGKSSRTEQRNIK